MRLRVRTSGGFAIVTETAESEEVVDGEAFADVAGEMGAAAPSTCSSSSSTVRSTCGRKPPLGT